MASSSSGRSTRRGSARLLVVSVAFMGAWHCLTPAGAPSRTVGLAQVAPPSGETSPFMSKVISAAAQGATAAAIAAVLSAFAEPIVNRLLVKRMTFAQAYGEIYLKDILKFFLTTFPTNMLKFPVFEVINMAMSFTSLAGSVRGVISGAIFCTIMLPVTNYRFRKSMNLEIKAALLYQAYIPTLARDIVYGWARGLAGPLVASAIKPQTFFAQAFCFGLTIWAACIVSSPGNEWRGFTLQPPNKKLPFKEYFKPVNYARSTGVGATIMGIALMAGMLITPYVEALVGAIASML